MQNQRMRTCYVPLMYCEKMDVAAMFGQRAVIELLVKKEHSAGVIYERFHGVYGAEMSA
jgi:hypothetical protein